MIRAIVVAAVCVQTASAQTADEIRGSIQRALAVLQRSAASFVAQRACVSCHHNILPILMLHMAADRGFHVDSKVLGAVEEKTFKDIGAPGALDEAILAETLNDPTPNDSFLLMAADTAGIQPNLTLAVYAARMANWQRDGHWVTSDFRPPHSSSYFTATATAVRAIQLYMPEELRPERDACIERARQWLMRTPPISTEDASFRLLGMIWADAPNTEIEAARHDLMAFQLASGGWPQLPSYQPDAYSTGEALFALNQAAVPATNAEWRKGLKFLLSTQAADGTWRVNTRMLSPASVSPKYFTTGFPYRKDEYISYAGSCWATMALVSAVPKRPPNRDGSGLRAVPPPWIRTALFGTVQELQSALDSGLDANSKTERGATLLMMSAPNADKVRLLLARGADAKTAAKSGRTALSVATAYRGTATSLRLLLDAGAPDENRALVLAAMSGDLENVRLLAEHGADPSPALAQAVTFGYPDIVDVLIGKGASATMTERSGINLLHWAAIADRPEVVAALSTAGASINAKDASGFTPLMYAATIDFGNTEIVKALLRAGADPSVRNNEGRNAREQAKYFHHAQIEEALR
jgi:ankyrin repeat protein